MSSNERSVFSVTIYDFTRWFENTSKLNAEELCKVYAACEKPYIDMEAYGEDVGIVEYALIEQRDGFLFSLEFNETLNTITFFDGDDWTEVPYRETLQRIRNNEINDMKIF